MVLEKTLESPLDSKEIKLVNPKGNQPWISKGRTNAEAPILWPPDEKSWRIGKDPDAGKDWGQEEKGVTEDEMVWWHHQLNGHESEQTLGGNEGQGSLECCSSWGFEELDMAEWLNNNSGGKRKGQIFWKNGQAVSAVVGTEHRPQGSMAKVQTLIDVASGWHHPLESITQPPSAAHLSQWIKRDTWESSIIYISKLVTLSSREELEMFNRRWKG